MRIDGKWIIFILCLIPKIHIAQNLTSSPYSVFGIGEINTYSSSRHVAMGNTGIGLKSEVGLNNINPASYSNIDSSFFIYEIGVLGKYSSFATETGNQDQVLGNLCYLSMGFRAKSWWGLSIGLKPFSSKGYEISTNNYMKNDNSTYQSLYNGSGGINQVYMGNSFKILKNVSLGLNLSYLFGSLDEDEDIYFDSDIADYTISDQVHVKGFYLDYGFLIDLPMNKYTWTIGAVYGHKRYLNSSVDRTIYDGNSNILDSGEDLETQDYIIPRKLGVGISLTQKNKFSVAFDYTINQWSEIDFSNSYIKTKDSQRFSLGLEFTPEGRYSYKTLNSWYYRIGGYYNSSYLDIKGNSINSMALTFGLGIPVKRNLSMFNIAFEIGKNGTLSNGLIQENFYTLNLNFSLQDIWFLKRKYD